MIGWLSGKVVVRDPAAGLVVLNVGGVGYQITVPLQTLASIPGEGKKCELWIHTHVREEVLALYGFASPREKGVFKMLTSVPKVGPKNAIAVLGGFPLDDVIGCIGRGEAATLQRIPGIGKKTAEQIVLSLQEKMAAMSTDGGGEPSSPSRPELDQLRDEAAAALVQWGWKAKPVASALEKVMDELDDADAPLEDVLRRATRLLTER
jgi:Holliday junction DNA helicase RuvA